MAENLLIFLLSSMSCNLIRVFPLLIWFIIFPVVFIVAFGQEYDDDELEAELADLEMEGEEDEQAKLDALLLNPDPVPTDKLPDVPEHVPVAAKSKKAAEKDDDLADLEKWAAAS